MRGAALLAAGACAQACDFRRTDDFWKSVASSCRCQAEPTDDGHCAQLHLVMDPDPSKILRCNGYTSDGCREALELWWHEIEHGCGAADPNYEIVAPAVASCRNGVDFGILFGVGVVLTFGGVAVRMIRRAQSARDEQWQKDVEAAAFLKGMFGFSGHRGLRLPGQMPPPAVPGLPAAAPGLPPPARFPGMVPAGAPPFPPPAPYGESYPSPVAAPPYAPRRLSDPGQAAAHMGAPAAPARWTAAPGPGLAPAGFTGMPPASIGEAERFASPPRAFSPPREASPPRGGLMSMPPESPVARSEMRELVMERFSPPQSSPPALSPPPMSFSPPPQSFSPPPVSMAPAPLSMSPPPMSISPAPRSFSPPPMSLSPPPQSFAPPPRSFSPPPRSLSPESAHLEPVVSEHLRRPSQIRGGYNPLRPPTAEADWPEETPKANMDMPPMQRL